MKVVETDNKDYANLIREKLKLNDGYCPCVVARTPDTKCMCKAFREQAEPGECHCGLYVKVEE